MFGTFALTILFSALVTRADVVPSAPGPGVVFKTGGQCRTDWSGDSSSNTVWKGMSIELMSGSNFDMVHLTTVAQNQDGTVSGFFTHTCPDVTPNAAIYFYQYTSPDPAGNKTWTTRFTIAGADGSTVPPANAIQPTTGAPIPWGSGALKDPSTAVSPPSYLSSSSSSNSAASSSTSSTSSSNSSTVVSTSTSTNTLTPTQTGGSTVTSSSTSLPATTTANTTSAAMGSVVVDSRVLGVVFTLVISAVGFSVLL